MMLENLTTILFEKGFQKQSDYNFYIFIYASFETKENIVKFNSSKTNIKSKKLNMY